MPSLKKWLRDSGLAEFTGTADDIANWYKSDSIWDSFLRLPLRSKMFDIFFEHLVKQPNTELAMFLNSCRNFPGPKTIYRMKLTLLFNMTRKLEISANSDTNRFLLCLNSISGWTTQRMRDIRAGRWQTPKRMTTPKRVSVRARFRLEILSLLLFKLALKASCRWRNLNEVWLVIDVASCS